MKISDFTREQLQFFLDNEEKIKKELLSKKYGIGDCFILFDSFYDVCILKVIRVCEDHYVCTYIHNNVRNNFDREKRNLNDKDLDSYIKIESSLYESIDSFVQSYVQRRYTNYKQLDEKYKKEITKYIKNLKQSFK